jgi:P-type Ca2+ transporter type 2C
VDTHHLGTDPPGASSRPGGVRRGADADPPRSAAGTDERERLAGCQPGEVYRLLGSDAQGLASGEAGERARRDGPNRLTEIRPVHPLRMLLGNLTHLMAVLLWVGGAIALVAELPQLAVAVWLVNLINGVFSTWQEHRAERAVAALRSLLPPGARVLRDGVEVAVLAEEVVVGDVLLLGEGDRVAADARLVEAHELRVDQSTLTGESRPVRRTAEAMPGGPRPPAEALNRVFAGTMVTSGRGKAVVHAIGMATEFGAIAGLTQGMKRELSPLQRELETLTRVVGAIAITVGLAFFGLAQLATSMPLDRGLVFALGMIVAFVPEGLLPTVTLSLAMGTQRMAQRHALVKRLSAVEALGATTVICTDKTGTLTANQMTVRAIVVGDDRLEVTGTGYDPAGELQRGARPVRIIPPAVAELVRTAALANDAHLVAPDPAVTDAGWRVTGDPTEAALLVVARKLGTDLDQLSASLPRVGELPFDAVRRMMSTVHEAPGGRLLCCKGAPRELLDRCATIRVDGVDQPLDAATRERILARNDELSAEAMRVLGVAVRRLDDGGGDLVGIERELTWLGLVGMLDPPRPAVTDAVATCAQAGIRILMITGDYGITAESIARRIGLIGPGEQVRLVNGDELESLADDELNAIVAEPVLFARATPSQKLRIVTALQANGEVVAVTGDGVNDAPALKRADIGVAMGASGTDVAREAADIVLLDDDFASIVAAVEEGRAVYANVRRFTGYIFTSNTPEAVPFVIFGLSGGRIPIALDVMHILAIDLGTDLVPALGLGAEPPEPGLMDRPPRRRDEHLITPALLRRSYLVLGPAQAAATMGMFWLAFRVAGVDASWTELPAEGPIYAAATAAALAAVVMTQIGNLLAHRTERASIRTVGLGGNRLLWVGIASELLVIAAIVYLPPFQAVIGTAAFAAWLWLPLVALSPLLLVIDEARKALLRWLSRRRAGDARGSGEPARDAAVGATHREVGR